MAEPTAATDAVDTGRSDDVNTSTNEDDELDLDSTDLGWDEGEQVDDKQFDANGKEVPASTDDEGEDDSEDDAETEETTTEEVTEADQAEETASEEETEVAPQKDAGESALTPEEQKRHNDEMAKARIRERDAKAAADKAEADANEATIERYLREAGDDPDELARRELNVEAYRVKEERITVNQDRLQAGIDRAVGTIDLFKTGSPAVQEELASSLDDFEARFVIKDKTGRPVEIKTDPATGRQADVVRYLQAKADSIKKIQGDGAVSQERSKSNEKTRTLTTPVRAPKKAKADAQVDAFDAEADRW